MRTPINRPLLFLFSLFLFLSEKGLFAQNDYPKVAVSIQEQEEYVRHPRLQEEDIQKGQTPVFSQGLEIITDIEYVKVYISENEAGRTPYEDSDISIGYYRIKLVKPGYENVTIWANIKRDERTTITVQYVRNDSEENGSKEKAPLIRQGAAYQAMNPDDPLYYTRIIYSKELFNKQNWDLLLADAVNTPLITLSPAYSLDHEQVYYWDGLDVDGKASSDGLYTVYAVSSLEENSSFTVDRRFSRKASSYFSGFTGLSLVPSAQPLFKGSFQFGSSIGGEISLSNSGDSTNLPFSFFLRFSPLQGWEAAMDAEVSMNQDNNVPQIKVNTSQKVLISRNKPFLLSVNGRFSYRANINDFSDLVYNKMVRDPAGTSLAFPIQLKVNLWDFYFAPEGLYSFEPVSSSGTDDTTEADFRAVMRWGLSYSERYFQAGFSSALFSGSIRGATIIMQTCGEVTIYMPRSPLYINTHAVYQKIKDGGENLSIGLGVGFLI